MTENSIVILKDNPNGDYKFIKSYSWLDKEKDRLNNIIEYNINDIQIDDPELVSLAKLAAYICNTPIALVNIVTSDRIEHIGRYNFSNPSTARLNSFCTWLIEQDGIFEVKNAILDNRFSENEYVNDYKLRYYAGCPLKSREGYNLGSLCVCDLKPNALNENQKDALITLSEQVVNYLDLKRKNKNLLAANALAEKLSNIKDEFFSNISHELRTPLNAIHGFAEILSKCQLTEEQINAVITIKNSSEILISIINDILDFSKINSGKISLDISIFNLNKTVKLVYDLLFKKAEQKGLEFILDYDPRIPEEIIGDKVRVNQIIMNLAGNSIKFTEKGSVRIDVNLIEETEQYARIKFSVKDTGIGISQDKINSIFKRFEQAEGGKTYRKYGGTGLGLNISKNLVEIMGGRLNINSVYGQGSEFYFIINFEKPTVLSSSKADLNSIVNLSLLQELKILVCEDNPINIKLIEILLKSKVSELNFVDNGESAIELLNMKNFDLILMDIHMPKMDGIQTTEYIRNVLKSDIPILGFTANTTLDEREICLEKGMNDYFLKTFIPHVVFEKIIKNVKKYRKIKRSNSKNEIRRSKSNANLFTSKEKLINNQKFNEELVNKKSKCTSILKTVRLYDPNNLNKKMSLFNVKKSSNEDDIENRQLENLKLDSPRFDHVQIEKLKEYTSEDESFLKQYVEVFLNKFPQDVKSLEDSISSEKYSEVIFLTHKMKSPLLMLGLIRMNELLENIKTISTNPKDKVEIKRLFDRFKINIEYIYEELRDILKT
jgi:signal transduction histidine kinase/DNA-binding response OmpR family regulator